MGIFDIVSGESKVEDKNYDTDLKDRGIKEIVKYSIAFSGKNVEIARG